MFGSNVLEIGIGLVFIYLTLSIICVALTEWVARMVALRSRTLYAGVRYFLSDDSSSEAQNARKLAENL